MRSGAVTWLRRWLAAALVVLMFSACAGSDSEPRRMMLVVGTEMAFEAPDRTAAGDYSVTFRNAGMVPHELAFRDPSGEFVMRRSIAAGQTIDLEVELTPGTWELGCYEPGHYEAGMFRGLLVEEA